MNNILKIEEVTVALISCKTGSLCQTGGNADLQKKVWRAE